ncbi:MAG: GYD domain-containing protein [Chloroflexi bacterium]|nr:GYD domain-containing protein [Chloroflexota bacterium]
MATFVILGNWTEKGAAEFARAPARARANEAAAAAMGGRIVATYWTLGQYDFVSIVEAPSDELMTAGLQATGAGGTSHTETLRAFDIGEMESIIGTAQSAFARRG